MTEKKTPWCLSGAVKSPNSFSQAHKHAGAKEHLFISASLRTADALQHHLASQHVKLPQNHTVYADVSSVWR